jgi:hypothetical protein
VPISYYPDPLAIAFGTPLGLAIQQPQVGPDGSVEPLLYWDFAAGKWVAEDSDACLKPLVRESGADARAQYAAVPVGVLARPGTVFKLYSLGADGSRGEVMQVLGRIEVEARIGAN